MARSIELDAGSRGGDLLTVALGTSVLLWAVAYVWLSPAVNGPPVPLAGLALLCLLGAGLVLGRLTGRGAGGGVKLGLLLGFINFIIVASFHGREARGEALLFGFKWIVVFTLIAAALGAIGAAAGARIWRDPISTDHSTLPTRRIDWTSRLAIVFAAAIVPLLISGGIVTGLDAGLAVPDWLTTFGYPMMFYPLIAMQEDDKVYAEHFHRLWGLLVGLSAMLLAFQIHRADPRVWIRRLSILIVLAVVVQGAIGGGWVLDTQIRFIAVGHGVFGQVVFVAVVAMAAFTSSTWALAAGQRPPTLSTQPAPRSPQPAASAIDVQASIALFLLLLVQLAFGATYRHLRREALDATAGMHALWAHIILATILIGVVIFVAGRAWGVHREKPVLPRLGVAMLHLLFVQIALGVAAFIAAMKRGGSPDPIIWEVAVTTAHQAVGALMLALSGLLVVWSRRLL